MGQSSVQILRARHKLGVGSHQLKLVPAKAACEKEYLRDTKFCGRVPESHVRQTKRTPIISEQWKSSKVVKFVQE